VKRALFCLAVVFGLLPDPAGAYVDHMGGFTLGYVVENLPVITVLRVEKVSLEKRAIVFTKVADLKGRSPGGPVKHQLKEGLQPQELRTILDWAEPGRVAVCFHDGKVGETCIGRYWYQCHAVGQPWWAMTHGQGDLCFAYSGPAEKLPGYVTAMLAGREVIVPALERSADNTRAREAVFRNLPRGKDFPVGRIKASLKMPAFAYLVGGQNVVGGGAGGPEDVPPLIASLRGGHGWARREAAEELGQIGPAARDAVPAIRELRQDPDGRVRVSATLALAKIRPDERDLVPALTAAVRDSSPDVRAAAAAALGELGAQSGEAVAALAKAAQDADLRVRWAAVDALGRLGPAAQPAVPALRAALRDEHPSLRAVAGQALGEIGPGARDAMPALAEGLRDGEPQVRRQAAWSLAKLGGPGTPQARKVVRILTDGLTDPWEWGATLAVLVQLRADSVPALIDALKRGDVQVRKAAVNLFLQLSPDEYRPAVPALVDALKDSDGYVRFRAAVALIPLGAEARAALPALDAMLRDDWSTNRLWAAAAIGKIGRDKKVVPVLREALQVQADGSLRRNAAEALGAIGPEAKAATPALAEALKDGDAGVREAAAKALRRIQPK
jgi:HEAT repeat protein